MSNFLVYPCKVMRLTQNYKQGNHQNHFSGAPRDYPIDEAGRDGGKDAFYCPCDKMVVKKIYGVGGGGVNTVWLESVGKVDMPCGRDGVTILVEHVEDADLKKLHVGLEFSRGQKIFSEGKDGAGGNHFHLSVAAGTIKGSGWVQNDRGAWVLQTTGNALPPEYAFYLENTEVLEDGGLHFAALPKKPLILDNTPDAYAKKALAWGREKGIIVGDQNGNLKLHEPITRQDMLVMMYRATKATSLQ